MSLRQTRTPATKERLVNAGYELYNEIGISKAGVDRIAQRANCAKASLYSIFGSKSELTLAVLNLREERWTVNWLDAELSKRATDPSEQLMAVFDLLDEWFHKPDFEGCTFVNLLHDSSVDDAIRDAAVSHLERVLQLLVQRTRQAGFKDPEALARSWYMLVQGAIISARAGRIDAADDARMMAECVLNRWPLLSNRTDLGGSTGNATGSTTGSAAEPSGSGATGQI